MLALLLCLTACGTVTISGGASGDAAAPIIQIAQSPQDVVRAFLDGWNERNYETMYAQLSSESQGLTAFSVFRTIYEQADELLGTQNVRYTIGDAEEQGMTAAVTYDVTIDSSIFGEIEDTGRVMRVVKAPSNVWRVAWTQMDIFDGYAPGTRLSAVSTRPPRGNILDRNGVPLVEQDSEVVTIYLALNEVYDEAACLDVLAAVLRRNRAELLEQFNGYRASAETVFPIGDMDPADYARHEQNLLSVCNIRMSSQTTRRYAGHGIASHTVGYVGQISTEQLQSYLDRGYESGDIVGLSGIELEYEEELAGGPERLLRIVEPGGMTVRELAGAAGTPPQSVTLTLDYELQLATAQALSDAYNEAAGNWASSEHSTGAGAIVLDVDSGAVLALASYPTFDPGIFHPDTEMWLVGNYITSLNGDPRRPFINRVIQEQYPPGSVFKIVTLAAAAEERLFRPDQIFDCAMEWRGGEFGDTLPVRYDWRNMEPEERRFNTGEVTMSEALSASCNPFFYQMGALLARDRGLTVLGDYAQRMGLGRPTGLVIDSQTREASGQISLVRGIDQGISAAIGQSDMQVTIVQMARLVAGVANGGTLYTPYVVQQVGGEEGSEPTFVAEPRVAGEMELSSSTLDVVREGMCAVTTRDAIGRTSGQEIGTAWFVFDDEEGTGVAPYTACGKTGTAQTGRTEPHGWFVAYAPADNPEVAVAVMVESSREGSETAAPIVRRILDAYFDAPQAPFPWWWSEEPYTPLQIPEGMTGG